MTGNLEVETQGGTMKHLNVSEARANFRDILQSPTKTVVTRFGRPVSVVVPYEEYQALVSEDSPRGQA